jgi:hypothetical protein
MLYSLIEILISLAITADKAVLCIITRLAFMLAHIAILGVDRLNTKQKIFVIAFSFLAGAVFSFIIITLPYGWFFSYKLHLIFYYAVAMLTGEDDELIP